MIRIGTAGWSIPRAVASSFDGTGSHLERYARAMRCVEIDSSFHRPHRTTTYARWADATPDAFRFAVKLPRTITHDARLVDVAAPLDAFVAQVAGLGTKLAVLLVQLPPSLAFHAATVDAFLQDLQARTPAAIAVEPRHASWFDADADALLVAHRVARVAADPAASAAAARPGGWLGVDGDGRDARVYYRWHGAPRMYWSAYPAPWLDGAADELARWPDRCDVWCVFDNTAAGAALDDALGLARRVVASREARD